MFYIERFDRQTGKTTMLDPQYEDKTEAEHIAANKNSMEGRMTDGIVYVKYTVKEIKESEL